MLTWVIYCNIKSVCMLEHVVLFYIQAERNYVSLEVFLHMPPSRLLPNRDACRVLHLNKHLEELVSHFYLPSVGIEMKVICGCVAAGKIRESSWEKSSPTNFRIKSEDVTTPSRCSKRPGSLAQLSHVCLKSYLLHPRILLTP